jgi:hypothetical protein
LELAAIRNAKSDDRVDPSLKQGEDRLLLGVME